MPFLKEEDNEEESTSWRDILIVGWILVMVTIGIVHIIVNDLEGFAEAMITGPTYW